MEDNALEFEQEELNTVFDRVDKDYEEYKIQTNGYESFASDDDFIEARFKRNVSLNMNKLLNSIEKEPYFGRVFINQIFGDSKKIDSFAIGRNFYGSHGKTYIYDWRSEEANYFYANNLSEVKRNGRPYNIDKRRNLKIQDRKVIEINDSKNLIVTDQNRRPDGSEIETDVTDPYLLKILEERREKREYLDIIQTIQAKQNYIIRAKHDKGLLVKGCAGSGKTMVLLHRISYLLYHKQYSSFQRILVIIPSKKYQEQISDIVMSLGLSGLVTKTFDELIHEVVENSKVQIYIDEHRSSKRLTFKRELTNFLLSEEFTKNLKERYDNRYLELFDETLIGIAAKYGTKLNQGSHITKIQSKDDLLRFEYFLVDLRNKDKKSKDELETLKNLIDSNSNEFSLINYFKEISKRAYELSLKTESLKAIKNNQTGDISIERYQYFYSAKELEFLNLILKDLEERIDKVNKRIFQLEKQSLTNVENQSIDGMIEYAKTFDTPKNLIPKLVERSVPKEYQKEVIEIFGSRNSVSDFVHFQYYSSSREFGLRNYEYIHIDEYQDFSITQLSILRKLMSKTAVFNLYGDEGQVINRNFVSQESIKRIFNVDTLELIENYRNSIKITEYTNEELGLNMIPISIVGEDVEKIDIQFVGQKIEESAKDPRNRILLTYQGVQEDILIDNVKSRIRKDYLSLIDFLQIQEVKGLEYDIVFVLTQNMSRNMKYVAFTRALTKLYVVE